ncbi:MAG: type III-A CRISPR-associated RAMP protein Csm5 [Cyclobacteriaceae bacterium]
MKQHNIYIEVVSPVAVTTGEVLSPIADYVVNGSKINLIDKDEFENILSSDEKLMEKYLDSVLDTAQKAKHDTLKKVLGDKLPKCYHDISIENLIGQNNPVNLKTIVKNQAYQPYLPGSSIKGAIKFALLVHWLGTKDTGKEMLITLIEEIDDQSDEKKISEQYEKIEKSLFGDVNSNAKPDASLIRVSDSKPYESKAIGVISLKRKHLKDAKNSFDNFQQTECILPTFQSSLKIDVTPEFTHPDLGTLNKEDWLKTLFKQINYTSLMILKGEKNIIETNKSEFDKEKNDSNTNASQDIIHFYETLISDIAQRKNNIAYLPLGFGKTFFHISLGLLIKKSDPKKFENLVRKFSLGEKRQKFFPITRNITIIEGKAYPLGWIKLKKELNTGYTEEDIKSGEPIEAIFLKLSKPTSIVMIKIDNEEKEFPVSGTKNYSKQYPKKLQPGKKCTVYWRDNHLNFNK